MASALTSSISFLAGKPAVAKEVRARAAPAPRAAPIVRATADRSAGQVSRRSTATMLVLPATLLLPKNAWALIPDDDDEELIAKAKANRQARLKQDREQGRDFLKGEGVSTSADTANLVPVQKAIAMLAKAGNELEKGDLPAVASSAGGSWVSDFKVAAGKLSYSDESKAAFSSVLNNLDDLTSSAKANKSQEAKTSFVGLVDSLNVWVDAAGVESKLRGL
mmetsp:Transcript_11495/g.32607  ORF Transcript_11495/g.32607 Transcript_11495/m.32607 type:complete len:221 (-) Transcript_11495:128-790(-)|eukprot:CAMPEP_0117664698 /NCGR_PEP_ID=MMETSP0804-20121206/9373_1 /TAXON_ID=1074897 /ORGANISM="Tetraselmis astigmatica, Strain CCMP880" /LENGTH=220 /DNA_ID=CAMNT_0005471977 /DNA_START=142 /DNA_END=804 /DNA_ORIENTATION=+